MCRLKMMVFIKKLMSQNLDQFFGAGPVMFSELQERTYISLVCTSLSEPLNDTNAEVSALNSTDIDEEIHDCPKGLTIISRPTGRVPVVSDCGTA